MIKSLKNYLASPASTTHVSIVFLLVIGVISWYSIFVQKQIGNDCVNMVELTLRESSGLYESILEKQEQRFILLEQRIVAWQDLLNNSDLNSTELTTVQAEMADTLQLLKHANETEMADVSESVSE